MALLENLSSALVQVIIDFPKAILIVNRDSQIMFANHAAQSMFSYSAKELEGTSLDKLIPLSLREKHRGHVKDFIEHRQTARVMGQSLRVSGIAKGQREFPLEATIVHLGTVDGQELAMVMLEDISNRFPSQEFIDQYLKGQNIDLLAAFDELPDAVVVLDSDWNYRYTNKAALDRLKQAIGSSRVIGQNIWKLRPKIVGTPFEKMVRASMRDKRERELEDYYPDSGVWYRSRIIPAGSMVILHIIDITSLKQTEASNQRLTKLLDSALDMDWDRSKLRRLDDKD